MTDTIDSIASVGAPTYATDPSQLRQTIAATSDVDNRNGLMTGPAMVSLSHTYSTTQTFTHATTTSIRVGVAQQYSLQIKIPGASIGANTTISFDKTWTTSDSTTESTTNSSTFTQSINVLPPIGKVYRAVLTFMQNHATVPYWLNLHCRGTTETWYRRDIAGHMNWKSDAVSLVIPMTADDYTLTGLDPTQWGVDQNGIWTKGVAGTLDVDLIGSFNVSVVDVTGQAGAL